MADNPEQVENRNTSVLREENQEKVSPQSGSIVNDLSQQPKKRRYRVLGMGSVSYTHLTLPTILLV